MSDFLYPFIEGEGSDAHALLDDLARSAQGKADQSRRLQESTRADCAAELEATARDLATRLGHGGRLLVFGNGGSSTDAEGIVGLFRSPPWGRALAAQSLVVNPAVVTALGNDVGFDLVFSRQLIAHGRAGDVALGMSTSGSSPNLLEAFAEARRRGMLTVGMAGYDGGRMATTADVDHCIVVHSDSVHRIQETQAAVAFELWERVQAELTSIAQGVPT